jgi:hypothetical protein
MNALVPVTDPVLPVPADDVSVYVAPHPLRQERVALKMAAGTTIAEMVQQSIARTGSRFPANAFVVYIEGHPIPPQNWRLVRAKPGSKVAMRPVTEGPLFALFGAIGSAISAISTALGALGFFGKLLLAGISFAAKLLLQKLFAPKQPTPTPSDAKPSYSIAGSRNSAQQYAPVPVILGKHRTTPLYGAAPYTEVVGNDQYLRMLFIVGYGPLTITDLKIGETPIGNFKDVTYSIREGVSLVDRTQIYPLDVLEEQLDITLTHAAGFVQRTTSPNIFEIGVDIVYPQGLCAIGSDGTRFPMLNVVQWRYRKVGDVAWTNAPDFHIWRSTQKVLRFSQRVVVPEGQYQVQLFRLTQDYAARSDMTYFNEVHWTAVRGFRVGEPVQFTDPVALVALRIRATSQLNGVIDTFNCVASSRVKAWSGTAWVADTESRNPADLFRYVLQCNANKRPVDDSKIDLTSLQLWHSYCNQNGWTYDKPVTAQTSVFDILQEICAAGRAMPVFRDGKWSVVWDEQNTPIVQMFTPRNSWGFEAQQEYNDLPHAFRVRFVNAAKKYIEDERIVYDDGYTKANATRFEGFEVPGVTDSNAIWRHGRFHIAQLRLRPATYTLNVDFEGLVLTRNDRVRVQHDVMLVGLGSGRVKSTNDAAQTVTVDETLTLDGSAYQFRFRLSDGTFLTRNIVPGTTGELTTLPLVGSPGDSLPADGDLFTFGLVGSDSGVYRVFGVEPQGDNVHRLTLVDDAPSIYLADNGAIPDFDSGTTEPVDPFTLPPINLRLADSAYQESGQVYAAITASWSLPRLGTVQLVEVEYRDEFEGVWTPAGAVTPDVGTIEIRKLNAGTFTVRVRSIFDDGTFSDWMESETIITAALTAAPPDVTNFHIATTGDISTLSWDAVAASTGVTYEVRFAPDDAITVNWNSASPLLQGISATSAQVQTLIGTFLIKAILPTGISSTNATIITTNVAALAGLNVIQTLTESTAFAGTKSTVEVIANELRLLGNNTLATWETLSTVVTLFSGDGGSDEIGFNAQGTYTFANSLDLGDVYTSRITAIVDAYGFDPAQVMVNWLLLSDVSVLDTTDASSWSVVLEFRTTNVDPALNTWSAWQRFVVGDVSFRAIQFRLQLYGKITSDTSASYAVTTPSVRALSVRIDMPDRVIAGNDIPVGVGGTSIVFSPAFRHLDGLSTALQDMATGDRAAITAKSETGFTIRFFDSVGSPVARTFDYVAKGYGKVVT